MPSITGFLKSIRQLRFKNGFPPGENPISTAARAILDRFNNPVPILSGLFVATASATVGNTGTETSMIGAGIGSLTLPANFLVPGKSINFRVMGTLGTKASPVGNLTIRLKLGSTTLATATVAALAQSLSGRRFVLEGELVCRTDGASGSIQAGGNFRYAITASTLQEEALADTTTSSFNTKATQALTITAQWATSDPANTLTTTLAAFEVRPAN